ncbi:MAG: CvpA family protein [Anaerolineaceae bacterium]|nr:CvpA family protein [Anaerolineaceae bacterium]
MIALHVLFWIFVILFALIGLNRGWAKEMLVSFAIILGIFIINVLETFIPFVRDLAAVNQTGIIYWIRTILVILLVFFGYQGPNIPRLAATNRFVREKLQDSLLGFFLGALNGYLVIGSLWYFMNQAGYPFPNLISAPPPGDFGEASRNLIELLPPIWLHSPTIYFAVAICFAFVLVVLI